jgi:GT2 family glycosyltransferase
VSQDDRATNERKYLNHCRSEYKIPVTNTEGESSSIPPTMNQLGIVIIGRNEGERLCRSLTSVVGYGFPVIYVDSGSTDKSLERAREMGVEVVELDMSYPFTAARARNAGFARLEQVDTAIKLVQFADGDCEVVQGWLDSARRAIDERPDVAVVFGRRRERYPDQTIYNRLADLEWNVPIGEVKACVGDAMVRVEAFRRVNGYDPSIIAAEDDELCLRIRKEGWIILRIDADMTLHDIAMTRFGQWWMRSVRCGHAYAEGSARYGHAPEYHFVRETRSALCWGLLVPLLALGLAWPTRGVSLVLLVGYTALFWRTQRYYRVQRVWPAPDARLYAAFCLVAKLPHVIGIVKYWSRRMRRVPSRIIEYRGHSSNPAPEA